MVGKITYGKPTLHSADSSSTHIIPKTQQKGSFHRPSFQGYLKQVGTAWLLASTGTASPQAEALAMPSSGPLRHPLPLPSHALRSAGAAQSRRSLQQVEGVASLPVSQENKYAGQPAATDDDYLPVNVGSLASLFGPTGQPELVHLSAGQDYRGLATSNSYLNAGMAALIRQNISSIENAIQSATGPNGTRVHQVRLHRRGKPVTVNVDASFYRKQGSSRDWLGNAFSLGKGSTAYWSALVEKAFVKLVDSFPEDFLLPADAEVVAPTGDPELDEFRDSFYGGYNLVEFALAKPTFSALTSLPVESLRVTPANRDRISLRLQDVAFGRRTAIFAFLDDLNFRQSAAFVPANETISAEDLFNSGELHFNSGNRCITTRVNTVTQLSCNGTQGDAFALKARAGYTVMGPAAGNDSIALHEAEYLAEGDTIAGFEQASRYLQATSRKPFFLPFALAADLNATLLVTSRARNESGGDLPAAAPAPAKSPPGAASVPPAGSPSATSVPSSAQWTIAAPMHWTPWISAGTLLGWAWL